MRRSVGSVCLFERTGVTVSIVRQSNNFENAPRSGALTADLKADPRLSAGERCKIVDAVRVWLDGLAVCTRRRAWMRGKPGLGLRVAFMNGVAPVCAVVNGGFETSNGRIGVG